MNIDSLISQYAKETKCSKAKLQAFADAILAMQPKQCSSVGRKASDESIRLRSSLLDVCKAMKGERFTTQQLAQKLNADKVYINNALGYLIKHGQLNAIVTGKQIGRAHV